MDFLAKWICPKEDFGEICPIYRKKFEINEEVREAVLHITSIGVYEAFLNATRVGNFYLAPGWTEYGKRIQYQSYDVSEMLKEKNELAITVGKGWCRSRLFTAPGSDNERIKNSPPALLAQLEVTLVSGEKYTVISDKTWTAQKSRIVFSDIYDGEIFDAIYCTGDTVPVKEIDVPVGKIIKNESVTVCAHERIMPARCFITPKNESVIDFGQNLTGIIELNVKSKYEQKITVSFAEVLDKNGDFYNENYRSAKSEFTVFCQKGEHTYCPHFTFFGFRFSKIECEYGAEISAEAIAIYSDIRQTGNIISSNPKLNKLYKNILWGQKDNFLDVPTDCPQRDERLGWTGDAQAFILAACYNFNVKKFFEKWLNDVAVC